VLCKDLQKYFDRHKEVFRGHIEFEPILNAKYIHHIDEHMAVKIFKYPDFLQYYESSSSEHKLPKIKVPVLFINSIDDPVVNHIPKEQSLENPNLLFVITQRGGHIGFLKNPIWWNSSWADDVAIEYFTIMNKHYLNDNLKQLNSKKPVPMLSASDHYGQQPVYQVLG